MVKLIVPQWTKEPKNGSLNLTKETTVMAPTPRKGLEPCPDTPPHLSGPLFVEFNSKRSLDDIRKDMGPVLKEGGRYKPPDCIALQKV